MGLVVMGLLLGAKAGLALYDPVRLAFEHAQRWPCNSILLYLLANWLFYNTLYSFYYVLHPWFHLSLTPCISHVPETQTATLLRNEIYLFPYLIPHIAMLAMLVAGLLLVAVRNFVGDLAMALMLVAGVAGNVAIVLVLRAGLVRGYDPSWSSF
jgi:hypothetical protein